MGCILAEETALFECLHDERDVALFEVAHAAVDELGAAAGGAFAEVLCLKEQHIEAADSGINGDANAGRAAADDDNIPGSGPVGHTVDHFLTVHCLLSLLCCGSVGLGKL